MAAPQVRADRLGLGILLMLAAWGLFAILDTTVKWLVVAGTSALFMAFVRYIVAFLCSLLAAGVSGPPEWPKDRATRRVLWVRGLLLGTTTAINFIVLKYLPLTVTSAILFSSPIIVCLLSVIILRERIGPWRWGAIVLGFAGVLIVLRPFGADFNAAAVLVLYNATAIAVFSLLTRRVSGSVSSVTQQVTANGIGTLIMLPVLPWTFTWPSSLTEGCLFVLVGVAGWAGHEAFSRAHLYGSAAALMPFSYSFLVYLTLTSWLVFQDLPDLATWTGALVITASGLLIWWRETGRDAP